MKTAVGNPYPFGFNVFMCWGFGLTCFMLGGCTTVAPAPPAAPAVIVEQTRSPLDYYAWVKTATESELEVELFGLAINSMTSDPVVTAVRTIMILSTSALANDETELRVLELTNEVPGLEAKDDISKSYKIFAEVMQPILQQRQELQKAATANQLGLREIDSLKRRNRQLQQQIEELTSIEQQIIEREQLNTLEP